MHLGFFFPGIIISTNNASRAFSSINCISVCQFDFLRFIKIFQLCKGPSPLPREKGTDGFPRPVVIMSDSEA